MMTRVNDLRALAGGLLAPAVLGMSACGAAPPPSSEPATITLLHGDDWMFSPCQDGTARLLVSAPLMAPGEDGELEPRLATGAERAPDGTWTVRLRDDVRWHDGVPFTAADVKFNWELTMKAGALPPASVQVEVVDDTTFEMRSIGVRVTPRNAWNVYYPEHLLKDLPAEDVCSWEFWLEPVGNGPFRFVRRVPKTVVELEANPNYFPGKPRIERVLLKFGENAITELLAGSVDAAEVEPIDVVKLAADPRFRVYYELSSHLDVLYWNQARYPPFRDPRVRRALTLAIDRRQLHRVLDLPPDLPLHDGATTRGLVRRDALPPALPYDTAEAARLLTAAGWRDYDGDGIRERDGEPFRFQLLTQDERWAVFVRDQLQRVGVDAQIATQPALLARLQEGDFQALVFRLYSDMLGKSGRVALLGRSSPFGYHDPAVVSALDSLQRTTEPEEAERLALRLAELTARDLPFTVLAPQVSVWVAHRRVRGLRNLWRAHAVYHLENLWLEDEVAQHGGAEPRGLLPLSLTLESDR